MDTLKIRGYDYSPIINGLSDTVIDGHTLTPENQVEIVKHFLKENNYIKPGALEILPSKLDTRKHNILAEYDENSWGGLVGVIYHNNFDFNERVYNKNIPVGAPSHDFKVNMEIQIQSRFDKESAGAPGKPYFLSTMLLESQTGFNDKVVHDKDEIFFDLLLLYVFKEKAKKCAEKGFYKCYRRFERNDDRLKGTIDISRHIRLNMGLSNGKIAYSYRENTIDNYLNHLILAAFDRLKRKYPELVNTVYSNSSNSEFKNLIDILRAKIGFSTIDERILITKNLKPISHPYYIEYDELRKISLRILRDEGLTIFDGDSDDTNGLLIYIPTLWELYLESKLKDKGYTLYIQGLTQEGAVDANPIKVFNHMDNPTVWKQETYPDYVFESNNKNVGMFMVLDAKFKPGWGDVIRDKKKMGDLLLNDYTKCIRDMNSVNVHATGVVFPTNIDFGTTINTVIEHNISEYNEIDRFYTFPVYVPFSSGDYSTWYDDFSKKLDIIITLIKGTARIEEDFKKKYLDAIDKAKIQCPILKRVP